jgi:type II secretory pathway pseudopilin PulG
MIVVAIIAIIAGILVPNFFHARAQAATAACQQNLRAIATAAELVYTTTRAYPAGSGVAVDTSFGSTGTGGFKGQYLSQTPVDPAQSTGGAAAYLYTLNAAVNGRESYTIVCPGVHDASTLAGIAGETGTQSSLTYSSDTGIGVK